jgi:hypothetical protein
MRAHLTEGEIAAEDGQPGGAECTRERDEKRRVAVCSRAMRQDEAIPTRIGWKVQKPSNWDFILRSVEKFSAVVHTHGLL